MQVAYAWARILVYTVTVWVPPMPAGALCPFLSRPLIFIAGWELHLHAALLQSCAFRAAPLVFGKGGLLIPYAHGAPYDVCALRVCLHSKAMIEKRGSRLFKRSVVVVRVQDPPHPLCSMVRARVNVLEAAPPICGVQKHSFLFK